MPESMVRKEEFSLHQLDNGFPVNASHNMPASVSQLLNKGIPEQIWPDFQHTSTIQQFSLRLLILTCAAPNFMAGRFRLIRIRAERLPSVPALNNLTLWRTSFSGSPLTGYLRRQSPAPPYGLPLKQLSAPRDSQPRYWPGEPSAGQGCSDSGSHFQALSNIPPSCAGYPSAAPPAQQNNTAVSTSRSDAIHPEGVTENG